MTAQQVKDLRELRDQVGADLNLEAAGSRYYPTSNPIKEFYHKAHAALPELMREAKNGMLWKDEYHHVSALVIDLINSRAAMMDIARVLADENADLQTNSAMWEKTANYWKENHDEARAGFAAALNRETDLKRQNKRLQQDLTCRSEQYRQAVALVQVQREEITAKDAYIERLRTAIEDALSYPNVDETMCPWCEMVDALEVRK